MLNLDKFEYATDEEARTAWGGTIDFGSPCEELSSAATVGYTYIDIANPANRTGKITSVELWFLTNATGVKVGSFYGTSPNITMRDYTSIGNVVAGSKQTFTVDIDVEAGDFIGVYFPSGQMAYQPYGGTLVLYMEGDCFDGVSHSYGDLGSYKFSMHGSGFAEIITSEGSIIKEGSYSLKIIVPVADVTGVLTRTLSPTWNLSGQALINFWVRASRTGSNFSLGFHDSGGTITEVTPNIAVADTWQLVPVDISAVVDANKDVIDSIILTILNADAENIIYLDNLYADNVVWPDPSNVLLGIDRGDGVIGTLVAGSGGGGRPEFRGANL